MKNRLTHMTKFLIAAWLLLLGGLAQASLNVAIEVNPDPVEPGEALAVQLTVTNSDGFDRTDVQLRMIYPEGLSFLSESAISDGGECVNTVSSSARCEPTELLVWNLGTIAAGTGMTVNLPPTVDPSVAVGSTIFFAPEVEDSAGVTNGTSRSVDVIADRSLELLLTAAGEEPVTAGGQLVYQLSYGHTATSAVAAGATLELPVPAGLTFVSADGGGTLSGGAVQWSLGTLLPGHSGERRATFAVDNGVANGTAITAQAVLQDTGGQQSYADQVTRVESSAELGLAVVANPNPVLADEVLGVELTVTNSGFFDRANVELRMRYPVGLKFLSESAISDGGECVNSVSSSARCEVTEMLVWNLGTIAAGTGVTVNLPPSVASAAVPGSLIGFDAQVTDSSGRRTAAGETVAVIADRVLELVLSEEGADPAIPGEEVSYVLNWGYSDASDTAAGTVLEMQVPAGLSFVSADGGGVFSGDTVQWTLGTLDPADVGERRVTFSADSGAANGTLTKAEAVMSDTSGERVHADEVTRFEAEVPLGVAVDVTYNPTFPGDTLNVELTVTNSSLFPRANVVLRMRYPTGLKFLNESAISDGGECVNSVSSSARCEPTEILVWNLGTITAGDTVTVSLPPEVQDMPDIAMGEQIEFVAWVEDSANRSRGIDVTAVWRFDVDHDGIIDEEDNCIETVNPNQEDTNGDGFGNHCDPDLNDDLKIDFADLAILKSVFFTGDDDADLNVDGRVDFADLAIMKSMFFQPPGPSAFAP